MKLNGVKVSFWEWWGVGGWIALGFLAFAILVEKAGVFG